MRHKCNIEIPETPPLIAGPGSKWDPLRVVPIQAKYLNLPLDPNSFYIMDDDYEYEWDDCREQKELSAAEQIACPGYVESNPDTIIGPGWMLDEYADEMIELTTTPLTPSHWPFDQIQRLREEIERLTFLPEACLNPPMSTANEVRMMQQQQSHQSIARIGEPFIGGLGRCGSAPAPPLDCCKLCGCKKSPKDLNEKTLCPKCADVEKLMAECLDETGKVDLSGHVGQREEIPLEDLSRMRQYGIYREVSCDDEMDEESSNPIPFHPRWPAETAADEYMGYLVVPFTNPLTGTTIRATEIGAEYQGVDGLWHPLSELDNS